MLFTVNLNLTLGTLALTLTATLPPAPDADGDPRPDCDPPALFILAGAAPVVIESSNTLFITVGNTLLAPFVPIPGNTPPNQVRASRVVGSRLTVCFDYNML